MNWLSAQSNTLIDLEQEKNDALDLETLRTQLASKPLLDGTDNPITLLEKRSKGESVAGLDSIEDALLKRLQKWYAKAVEKNPKLDKLCRLLLPLSDACPTQTAELASLSWPLDQNSDVNIQPDIQLKLALGLQAQAAVNIVACADLPKNAGQVPAGQGLVAISISGGFDAKASLTLPLSRFTLSSSAIAAGSIACSYYSLHDRNARLAPALAACFSRLESEPFDLEKIAKRFQFNELQCISLIAKGSISLSGQIALATPVTLGTNVNLAKLAYGYTAIHSGEFNYLLRADDDHTGQVLLNVNSQRENAGVQKLNAEIGLDLTSTYQRIREESLNFLGEAQKVLQGAETWLAPGEMIREQIKTQLDKLNGTDEQLLAPLLGAAFGFESGAKALDTISTKLAESVCNRLADLEGDVATVSAQELDVLFTQLHLTAAQSLNLQTKFKAKLAQALTGLQAQVNKDLRALAENKEANQITAALNEAGETIQKPLDTLDGKLAGLRLLVKRYRQKAAIIYSALQNTTQLKIAASLESQRNRTDTHAADLALRFDPASPEARQAFRHTLLGHFEYALELARAGGKGVELVECALSRVLMNSTSTGLEIAVLGFDLQSSSLLSVGTQIDSDSNGNLSVQSRAAYEQRRKILGETKVVRFADVFVVAAAKHTRSLNLDVTLSYQDDKLDLGEAKDFFSSLVAADLLSNASAVGAVRFLDDVDRNAPNCNHQGQLDVSLSLDAPALERLIGVGDANSHRDRVMNTAAREMAIAYVHAQGSWTREADIIRWLDDAKFPVLKTSLMDNVLYGIGPAIGQSDLEHLAAFNHASAINHMHAMSVDLATALTALRDIYLTPPDQLARWDAKTWQTKQNTILLDIKGSVPGDFPHLFGKETVRPRTLALFRTLAFLSGRLPTSTGANVLTGSMKVCGGTDQQLARIA